MDDFDNVAPTLTGPLFMPRAQRQALTELVRAIVAGEPFVALTGRPGVGKTTVLDTAVAVLAERGLRIKRIDNPQGTPLRLPQIIGELLGNAPGTVTNEDIERLFDALTLNNDGSCLVLVFDDAHHLQADVLGYLQIVSSLHALGIRNQQVIFAGRPEFWDLLEDPKLRDLAERIKARPVIEPLGEAEAQDFLYYRLEQMFGAIREQVSDAALSGLIQHGEGIPGRLDSILLKSLVAAGGYRQLGPETVDAGAYAFASGAPAVVVPGATEKSSGQMLASHPPPARIPERRHRVLHPGALVCLAVLLAGGIGTAWRSSVQPNPREISGAATTASTSLPEPPTQTAIMLAASAASPSDASAPSQTAAAGASDPPAPATPAATSSIPAGPPVVTVPPPQMSEAQHPPAAASAADASAPITAANREASPAAGSLSAGAGMGSGQDMSSPPPRAGDTATTPDTTSPAHASSPSADADAQPAQPQSSSVTPATSSPATPSTAAAPQPPPAAAASQPAPTSPSATDAAATTIQPATASVMPPTTTAPAVATQTTEPIDGQAKPPNPSSSSAATPSTTASSPSTDATARPVEPDHAPAAPAANPEVPISPAATEPTVLATQRTIVPGPVAALPSAQIEHPKTAAPAPAAPPPAVSATPAHLETLTPAAAGTRAPPAASPSPHLESAPTETQAALQPSSLPPEIVADLSRRGDAMLAIGDVASARLLYRRAAESGDARAATQLAKTYDPSFLAKIGAWGIPTDATTAAKWYRRAAALGDAEATERLKHLAEAGQ